MNKRVAVCAAAVLVLVVMSAWAADITGKWTAQIPGKGGQARETVFNFKVEDTKLTGTVSGGQADTPITDGKVSGNEISFTVKMSRQGNEVKMLYTGKVSGNEINFTRTREGSDQKQEFTAKRAAT